MKKPFFLFITISHFIVSIMSGQNVGIGTDTPLHELSVAGSIVVDHDNENTGSPTGPSLLFGTNPSLAAISSSKSPGSSSTNGLDFWTNGQRRMLITEGGTVGINVQNPDPNFDLFVAGSMKAYTLHGNSGYLSVNLSVNGSAEIGSKVQINGTSPGTNYRLYVNEGNSYFGGNGLFTGYLTVNEGITANEYIQCAQDIYTFTELRGPHVRATQNMAVGGVVDPAYRLRVWNGNSRFGGDVQVTGTLNAGDLNTDDIVANSINGTGVVRSNGPSPMRIGFDAEIINLILNGGAETDVTVNITPFQGDNDDVRVSVSHFDPDPLPQYANWHDFSFHIHSVNPSNDTCKLRITNTTDGLLKIKGILYLLTVAKN